MATVLWEGLEAGRRVAGNLGSPSMQDLVTGMQFRDRAGKGWFQIHRLKGCFPAYLDVASDEASDEVDSL